MTCGKPNRDLKDSSDRRFKVNAPDNFLERIVNGSLGTGMKDYSYEKDIFSLSFRLANGRFRDPDSGKIVNNKLSYLMKEEGFGRILGTYNPSTDEISQDSIQDQDGHSYRATLDHETFHSKSKDEYLARYHSNT
ncbi:hypothetical protein CMI42_03390 [Candidatus Pacearchaeota archaeon]|nr:hypothetical protein [Candidatus Pacearchaeota archaeon]|tara:strand:- start:1373 stop:1777 length:405 start_codon:yes stop_codon:yes gene_type:complete